MVAVVRKSRLELDKEAAIKMQLERLEEQARLKTHKGLVFKFEWLNAFIERKNQLYGFV